MSKQKDANNLSRNRWVALIVEAVIGSIFAMLLGYGVGRVMAAVIPAGDGGGLQDVVAGIFGLIFGSIAGATLGVALTGRFLMFQHGKWWSAAVGALLGVIAAFALAPLLLIGLDDYFPFVVGIIAAIGAAAVYGWS